MKIRLVVAACRLALFAPVTALTAENIPAAPDPLYQKILALDTAMFEAFNTCTDSKQLAKHASFFAADLESYHDNGGVSWTGGNVPS